MDIKKEKKLVKAFPWLGSNGTKIPYDMFGMECGDGWYDLLYDLFSKIDKELKKDPPVTEYPFYITQIKEKYGTLCVYTSWGTDKIYKLINEAEIKSGKTCEVCGAKAKNKGYNGWYRVVCKKCLEADK